MRYGLGGRMSFPRRDMMTLGKWNRQSIVITCRWRAGSAIVMGWGVKGNKVIVRTCLPLTFAKNRGNSFCRRKNCRRNTFHASLKGRAATSLVVRSGKKPFQLSAIQGTLLQLVIRKQEFLFFSM